MWREKAWCCVLNENRLAISQYRIEQARECLRSAQLLLSDNSFGGAANRSYYAIFNAIRAILALEAIDFKKHSAVISEFTRLFLKTEVFPPEFSKIIRSAFRIRTQSDYEDFYVISKAEVEAQVENAKIFFAAVETYIKTL
jgi:uncharacterized protein (UPF0332 family)